MSTDSDATLAGQAYNHLFEMILSGELPPGGTINEAEVSRRLEMSRGPVREAVRRLEGRRLVTREPQQKARVITFGPTEARELFEFREGLECVACRLATQRLEEAALADMAARLEAHHRGEARFDMHLAIAEGCGNARIRAFLTGDLYDLIRIYRRLSGAAENRGSEAYVEHWQILEAMRSRNDVLAESLMRSHVQRAARHITDMF